MTASQRESVIEAMFATLKRTCGRRFVVDMGSLTGRPDRSRIVFKEGGSCLNLRALAAAATRALEKEERPPIPKDRRQVERGQISRRPE
jgi:hypothetical protein